MGPPPAEARGSPATLSGTRSVFDYLGVCVVLVCSLKELSQRRLYDSRTACHYILLASVVFDSRYQVWW